MNADRGWGFLARDDGQNDLFFHHSALADPLSIPSDGARVEFAVGEDPIKHRPCAINVRLT